MLVSEYLVKYLESIGVEYVFGIPGGHLLSFYDALYNSRRIKTILTKHESAAAFMACGYLRQNMMVSGDDGNKLAASEKSIWFIYRKYHHFLPASYYKFVLNYNYNLQF